MKIKTKSNIKYKQNNPVLIPKEHVDRLLNLKLIEPWQLDKNGQLIRSISQLNALMCGEICKILEEYHSEIYTEVCNLFQEDTIEPLLEVCEEYKEEIMADMERIRALGREFEKHKA